MFGRNNLNRNGFFFHLLSEKENPTGKPLSRLSCGILYLGVNNLGLFIKERSIQLEYVAIKFMHRRFTSSFTHFNKRGF